MKKIYEKPELNISTFTQNDVITASGLTFGGETGSAQKESFGSLFGK